jgi:hypothetical protein
VIKAFDKSE